MSGTSQGGEASGLREAAQGLLDWYDNMSFREGKQSKRLREALKGRSDTAHDKSAEAVSETPAGSDITPDANAEWAREEAAKLECFFMPDNEEKVAERLARIITDAQDKALGRADKAVNALPVRDGGDSYGYVRKLDVQKTLRSLRKGE